MSEILFEVLKVKHDNFILQHLIFNTLDVKILFFFKIHNKMKCLKPITC